jgi:hypothetical protein
MNLPLEEANLRSLVVAVRGLDGHDLNQHFPPLVLTRLRFRGCNLSLTDAGTPSL